MTIVVDASVAVKWVLTEPHSDAADALLDEQLAAPVLWLVEAGNALWRRARLGQITAAEAGDLIGELLRAPVSPVAVQPHIERALQLAVELAHPIYDCLYLSVALQLHTHVVTADRRFAAAVSAAPFLYGDRVQLLGSS